MDDNWIEYLQADLADMDAKAQEPPTDMLVFMTDLAVEAGLDLASGREWIVGFLQADSACIWYHAPEGTSFYMIDADDFFDLGARYPAIKVVSVSSKPVMLVTPTAQEHAVSQAAH